jgi:hypothetical protein
MIRIFQGSTFGATPILVRDHTTQAPVALSVDQGRTSNVTILYTVKAANDKSIDDSSAYLTGAILPAEHDPLIVGRTYLPQLTALQTASIPAGKHKFDLKFVCEEYELNSYSIPFIVLEPVTRRSL